MSKERRTVSIESEVDEYLSSEGVNASQLINQLVKNHASSGGDERAMLELRAEQLRSDIEELTGRLETKENELERIEKQLEQFESEKEQLIESAADALSYSDIRNETKPAKYWADELDVTIEELGELVKQHT